MNPQTAVSSAVGKGHLRAAKMCVFERGGKACLERSPVPGRGSTVQTCCPSHHGGAIITARRSLARLSQDCLQLSGRLAVVLGTAHCGSAAGVRPQSRSAETGHVPLAG